MANKDQPQGARPQGELLRKNKYLAGAEIMPGDFVKFAATGKVVKATASGAVLGVAIDYASADGEKICIADHPDQRFKVQADEADINAQTEINLNYNILATAGDATYKVSRMELDSSTGAVTATFQLRLLDIVDSVDNALGANVECIVKINNHALAGHTGTVGI